MAAAEPKHLQMIRRITAGATRKGYLKKQGGGSSLGSGLMGWKKRWFCLKGAELYYFETSQEHKLLGKFVIDHDWLLTETVEKKPRPENFCFQIECPAWKQPRMLAAETDQQRRDWIAALQSVVLEAKEGKHRLGMEGMLSKQGPKKSSWKRRHFVLRGNFLWYFKQAKDPLPVGIITLDECTAVEQAVEIKNYCFFLDHPERRWYLSADSKLDMDQWMDALRGKMGLQKSEVRASMREESREVFLSKPIKEGILYKPKKRDQLKKTKPIRLVLTHNFVYYFPAPNSNSKYHTIHLLDCFVEPIPESIGKIPFSFRLMNLAHPLYLGAEDEKEYNTWINLFERVQQSLESDMSTTTDQADIRTHRDIDFSVDIINERISSNKPLAEAKSYDVKVKAFWTSWILIKTYEDFINLYTQLAIEFPDFILPEVPEEPLYVENIDPPREKRSVSKTKVKGIVVNSGTIPKATSSKYDFQFLQCIMRELLRSNDIAMSPLVLSFLELDSVFAAVKRGEISFVRYFLDQRKAEVNALNAAGTQSPLHIAAEGNYKQIAEALIDAGANPNLPNKKGQPPLHHAVEASSKDVAQLILEKGGLISAKDESGTSALHIAAKKGRVDLIYLLIEHGANMDAQDNGMRTPAHAAIIEGRLDSLEALIAKGANLDVQDEEGFSPLLTACWTLKEDIVKCLLEKKVKMDALDKNKRSAVHLAVLRKSDTILQLLVAARAPLDLVTGSGLTALHIATSKGNDKIAQCLVNHGADISLREENGQTALHIAAKGHAPKLARLLIKHPNGNSILDCVDGDQKVALQLAVEGDNIATVLMLLSAGAKMDNVDKEGKTALHAAAERGNKEIVQQLLNHKIPLNPVMKNGTTPLSLAIIKGHNEVVDLFLAQGVDLSTKDSSGNTPLHIALMNKQHPISMSLASSGASLSAMNNDGHPALYYAPQKVQVALQEASSTKAGK